MINILKIIKLRLKCTVYVVSVRRGRGLSWEDEVVWRVVGVFGGVCVFFCVRMYVYLSIFICV